MESWTLSKKFTFEAAHRLPNHDGKCARLHGHSWVCDIFIKGNSLISQGSKSGMLQDFGDIKKAFKPLLENYLDHYYLNESTGLATPTSETLAKWIYEKLKPELPLLLGIRIAETCTSSCLYLPEGVTKASDAESIFA